LLTVSLASQLIPNNFTCSVNGILATQQRKDYSLFGVKLTERCWNSDKYRYGFNNQESDTEINGDGNTYAFDYRIHDARLGRFMSIDPLSATYPFNSPYAFCENRVIDGRDLEGLEYVDADAAAPNFYNITSYGHPDNGFKAWMGKGFDFFKNKKSDCLTSCLIVYANANDVVANYLKSMPISPFPIIDFFKHKGKYKESGQHHSFIPPAEIQSAKAGDILYIELPGSFEEGAVDHAIIISSDPLYSDDGLTMTMEVHTTGGKDSKNFGVNNYTFTRQSKDSNVWSWMSDIGQDTGGTILGAFRVDQAAIMEEHDLMTPQEMPLIKNFTLPTPEISN
jgi:RHS repeat-associated protein